MIIHLEICDVCKRPSHGLPMQSFVSNGIAWDVGACCQGKRFTVVRDADTTKRQLLTRIEALVSTEMALHQGTT